ncbi:MAG: glycogen/starch/alpha-glucan phosphorylase [Clostridia bacterium]|nr:glycogen/starch/alpha-glucan phosphorylase [Clostridia bacterium]
MDYSLTVKQAEELVTLKLSHFFGVNPEEATDDQYYKAVALIVREMMHDGMREFRKKTDESDSKRIYYLSMEFLMGRSLKNNLYNLNLTDTFRSALKRMGVKLDRLFECEPDAGLGNGGLGRLAACYLDGLATGGYCAMGYSILYEYGIFRQKLVDGWQTELPDFWLPGGEIWLTKKEQDTVEVRFGGSINDIWDEHYHSVEHTDYTAINAIPYDMYVSGKDGKAISILRLWKSDAPGIDMEKFGSGHYLKAMERSAMAQAISKILYPADNHPEGKSLRLRQQYFFVSASMQDLVHRHLRRYMNMDNFAEKNAIHINDTHPTLAIPELMRIMLDECGYGWDEAWNIVSSCMAYTNHTVMKEALECWGEDLFRSLLPRIYQITKEIDNRYRYHIWETTHDAGKVENTAVISSGVVRMANLCVAGCHSVNGVSALHSQIIKDTLFNDYYRLTPDKFTNVTNGIAHRRWLCQSNPALSNYIAELCGNDFIYDASALSLLRKYENDGTVLQKLNEIKRSNKAEFSNYIKKETGIVLDPDSIFDVQVKRLHEYKRQHLNVFQIIAKYLEIKSNPNGNYVPHTYIFGAKAASGYFMAKKIILLIYQIAKLINNDPQVNKFLRVVFIEDYRVTMAEKLIPASEVSEQISLAGTEASGTSNMKFMLNGAVTLSTLDGANVEIHESVGDENMILFGMTTPEVNILSRNGYNPMDFYNNNTELKSIIGFIQGGVNGVQFPEIGNTIIHHDPYMVLADYADYRRAQKSIDALYTDSLGWAKKSLINIAGAGRFAADRAVKEYADNIWLTEPVIK